MGNHYGDDDLKAKILQLCETRGPEKSICPSEVARGLEAEEDKWRALLKPIRQVAIELARQGAIDVLKKGKPVDLDAVKGVIRLRLAASKS